MLYLAFILYSVYIDQGFPSLSHHHPVFLMLIIGELLIIYSVDILLIAILFYYYSYSWAIFWVDSSFHSIIRIVDILLMSLLFCFVFIFEFWFYYSILFIFFLPTPMFHHLYEIGDEISYHWFSLPIYSMWIFILDSPIDWIPHRIIFDLR